MTTTPTARSVLVSPVGWAIFLFLLVPLPAVAQYPDFGFTRPAYEENTSYSDNDAIFYADTKCAADNLIFRVNWGDGQWKVLKFTPQPPNPTPAGRLTFSSDHPFGAVGGVSLQWTVRVHCIGASGDFDTPATAISSKVAPHIPLHSLDCKKPQLAPGAKLDVTVVLTAPAPDSGTRVYLSADDKKLIVPKYLDIPAGTTHGIISVEAPVDVKQTTTVLLIATTIGKQQVLRLTIQP
jgi:hypothetical protein